VWPLEASGAWLRPLECTGRACSAVLAPTRCPAAGGATMHPAPMPPARNPALSEGPYGPGCRLNRIVGARKCALLHREGHRLLAHRSDRGGYPDIAIVPIAADRAASRQFVVAEPFSAKVRTAMPPPKWKKESSEPMHTPRACRSRNLASRSAGKWARTCCSTSLRINSGTCAHCPSTGYREDRVALRAWNQAGTFSSTSSKT
jgi:hypothetical protein